MIAARERRYGVCTGCSAVSRAGHAGWLLLFLAALLAPPQAARAVQLNGFDLSGSLVSTEEILSGGPPRDGIPAIDRPRFMAMRRARFLKPGDRVLGVVLNGEAKAYPIQILNWHEIVNDRVGEEGLLVSYCPLCGSGIVYRVQPGESFGVSGLLYRSDMLLYERLPPGDDPLSRLHRPRRVTQVTVAPAGRRPSRAWRAGPRSSRRRGRGSGGRGGGSGGW